MKMADVNLFIENGRILIGQANKRGNLKTNSKDVTKVILDHLVERLCSESGTFYYYKNGDKHYKVKCRRLTIEEIEIYEKNKSKRGRKAQKSLLSLLPFTHTYTLH
jgi:hypothetical protein